MVLRARTININDKQTLPDIISPGQFLGLFLTSLKWIKIQMCGRFEVQETPNINPFATPPKFLPKAPLGIKMPGLIVILLLHT